MGQINCDFLVNYEEITLTDSEIYDIKLFHFAVFKKVMKISKNAQVFDNRNKENSFFIVPVDKNKEGHFVIDWDLIRSDFCKETASAVVGYNPSTIRRIKKKINDSENSCKAACIEMRPGDEHMSDSLISCASFDGRMLRTATQSVDESREPNFTMTEAYYKYFVISPNYRNVDPPQYYVVSKVCHDMSPFSPFPKPIYENYYTYYRNKYEIEITNPNQPLLKVISIFQCSNFNKPRFKIGSRGKKSRDRFKEYEEHLIPELCEVSPFINKYWIKANLLPTFLNRIAHIYCVDEFRRKLVTESGLGVCEIPEDVSWHPLKVDEKLIDDEEDAPCAGFVPHSEMKSSLPLSELKNKSYQKNSKNIKDPERHLYEVGLCDLEYLINSAKEMEEGKEFDNYWPLEKDNEIPKLKSLRNIEIPKLMIFTGGTSKWGAELAELVKVGTAKSANDIVDYERLEILGDSFLKFATTLFLFRNYSYNEGILTSLKGKMIGNRNLLYCGSAKNIQNIINVIDFVPLSDWNPPLLNIPERLAREIVSNKVDPAVIYRFDISHEEQFSGVLSENTYLENEKIIRNYEKWCEQPNFSPYRVIKDKTVSDCVEALIGAYVQALGLSAAFEILMWMDILPKPKGSFDELVDRPYEAELHNFRTEETVMTLLDEVFYSDLEDTLGYHFKNKALLLEALTHPSYPYNRVTNCYQRLEFLGDAILDFLLTSYIYEYGGNLTPGQVTDLRSALVNNITFACTTVRYELHKYLLSFSTALTRAIETFVNHQITRNHLVDENVLILLEEKDCLIAESVQVPKALGDIFESLAGAIFIDSGNSLETVWNVYYKLMKREIDEFTKNVPKNSIRLLTEICNDKPYYECRECEVGVKVACTIYYNNHEIKTHGFGPNKKEAKRSAAKFAINKVLQINDG